MMTAYLEDCVDCELARPGAKSYEGLHGGSASRVWSFAGNWSHFLPHRYGTDCVL